MRREPLHPVTVDARGARELFGLGPQKLRELRRTGRLTVTKLGHRTLLYQVAELERIVGVRPEGAAA